MILKKRLKKLNDKELKEDIKKFIKSSHEFYSSRVPELKILANKLHEEHKLKDFYKIFDKFWASEEPREISLAIYTLQLYKDEFDINTWRFIKSKIKNLKSFDKIDALSKNIISEILIKLPQVQDEIISYSKSSNIWLKRCAIMSTISLVKKGDNKLALKIIENNKNTKNETLQKANGYVLREIGKNNPELLKKFISKNIDMPLITFSIATENFKDLRRLREKKISTNTEKIISWRNLGNFSKFFSK
ncbi:MAG: DNA alkylation repair protein [Candidatus Pacearchaeota archaeon]